MPGGGMPDGGSRRHLDCAVRRFLVGVGRVVHERDSLGVHYADGKSEEIVDLAHPDGVAAREVVVDGHDVHALSFEGVEVDRERGDEGLTLSGAHLGDVAAVERKASDELDVIVALAERAAGCFANEGERVGQDRLERLACFEAALELHSLAWERVVRKRFERLFLCIDCGDYAFCFLEEGGCCVAEDSSE